MFKKLLTLAAVAAMAYTAKAETVEAYYHDFSGDTSWNGYVMGYIPEIIDGELVAKAPMVEYKAVNNQDGTLNEENAALYGDCEHITLNGQDNYIVPLEEPAGWYQFFLSNGQVNGKKGMMHFITVCAYAPELEDGKTVEVTLQCRWSWDEDPINVVLPVTNKKEDITVVCNGPAADNFDVIYQLGGYAGEVHICTLKVVYENIVIEQEFDNIITNGDAAADWENPALTINDEGWQYISVWGKEDKGDPHPAVIETVDGDRVFAVHATAMTENPWDNQLWICAPQEFTTGDEFRISFRLKATSAAAPGTQAHKSPSNYLHWAAIGNPQFNPEWSNFQKDVTVDGNMSGMYSIAFNLNDFEGANDYYIDDAKWEIAKILEGWFIASNDNANGLLGAAKEMVADEFDEFPAMKATVGSTAVPAEWVKISTAKGSDSAFNAACIGIDSEIESGEPVDFEAKKSAKIELPAPGIWDVYVVEEFGMLVFVQQEAGIQSVNADLSAPVYYNLQGVRVDNPSNGIYIVKRGNKVSKQVIR